MSWFDDIFGQSKSNQKNVKQKNDQETLDHNPEDESQNEEIYKRPKGKFRFPIQMEYEESTDENDEQQNYSENETEHKYHDHRFYDENEASFSSNRRRRRRNQNVEQKPSKNTSKNHYEDVSKDYNKNKNTSTDYNKKSKKNNEDKLFEDRLNALHQPKFRATEVPSAIFGMRKQKDVPNSGLKDHSSSDHSYESSKENHDNQNHDDSHKKQSSEIIQDVPTYSKMDNTINIENIYASQIVSEIRKEREKKLQKKKQFEKALKEKREQELKNLESLESEEEKSQFQNQDYFFKQQASFIKNKPTEYPVNENDEMESDSEINSENELNQNEMDSNNDEIKMSLQPDVNDLTTYEFKEIDLDFDEELNSEQQAEHDQDKAETEPELELEIEPELEIEAEEIATDFDEELNSEQQAEHEQDKAEIEPELEIEAEEIVTDFDEEKVEDSTFEEVESVEQIDKQQSNENDSLYQETIEPSSDAEMYEGPDEEQDVIETVETNDNETLNDAELQNEDDTLNSMDERNQFVEDDISFEDFEEDEPEQATSDDETLELLDESLLVDSEDIEAHEPEEVEHPEDIEVHEPEEVEQPEEKASYEPVLKPKPTRKTSPFNVVMTPSDKRKHQTFKKDVMTRDTNDAKSHENKENNSNNEPEQATKRKGPLFVLPPVSILDDIVEQEDNSEWLEEKKKELDEAFYHFNVPAHVVNMIQGPTVTRFELSVEKGVKVSKITALQDDIKMALAAKDIRIEAPIPGTSLVGIEVPNQSPKKIPLGQMITSKAFQQAESKLTVAMGFKINNEPLLMDISKTPHALIAGATGSGKSVCINAILTSLLYKNHPDELKLLLIDPKMVELAPYNDLPHLVAPVITDVKAATASLKWAVEEMERRYKRFAELHVRNITAFNKKANYEQRMAKIIIVIDELADLMMMSPQEVEQSIARIAQKARASGIHMILATQRPSVNVITGLIKANVPTRISFMVSSSIDSRTILDVGGAEKLLGNGDMLYLGNGMNKPIRVQGAFVSDDEIDETVSNVSNQMKPNYLFKEETLLKKVNEQPADALFDDVCEFMVNEGHISTSLIQRHFQIGYNRAARMIDNLEERGFISGPNGSKPRDVLITKDMMEDTETNI
ncbi:DNA translocase FtsK [Mammaliicoccus vitulinus]|uniref:DNA translocase FtsK n=1 Tax=Mammaliicoccus vitulinus TaxID=71237 RepID=UPI003B9E1B64